jgi:hypothetical protein
MKMKSIVHIVVLAAALSVPLAAQTLSEHLQKGIFAEETLGDPAEAAKIYRQIIAAPAVPRAIAQEAERRLARLLASQRPTVQRPALAPPLPEFQDRMGRGARGILEQNRYRHVSSGITFDLPTGWAVGETFPSSDGGDMVGLTDAATGRTIHVWMIKEETPAAQVAARVAAAPTDKVRQRHNGYGIPGMLDPETYDIPQQNVERTVINGRLAVVAVGNYAGLPAEPFFRDASRQVTEPMNELMTWIYTSQTRVFFFARVPIKDLAALRPYFDQIVHSAIVP